MSAIFKWFGSDFEPGHQGFAKVEGARALPVNHLDYDWSLNGRGR